MRSRQSLLAEIRACTICQDDLPAGPRPILQFHPEAKILIASQAPGRKAHESGIPFEDASGRRLRAWMDITPEDFYDPKQVAILPMGFCYPGTGKSGDLPPRPECVPAWRELLLGKMQNLEITLVLGRYAQVYHFDAANVSVTQLVQSWRQYWPRLVPLPHPSPRNNIWLRKNSWFESELVPALQQRISEILASSRR